jgi:hypothetical protein
MGLERGPLSLVSTTEERLDRKVAAPVYKTENTTVGIRHADHVAITSSTSGGRSVGIVRSRTQTMEFSFSLVINVRRNMSRRARNKTVCIPSKSAFHSPAWRYCMACVSLLLSPLYFLQRSTRWVWCALQPPVVLKKHFGE